jgi:autotransporter passenger strand-loop-strand repeat protein
MLDAAIGNGCSETVQFGGIDTAATVSGFEDISATSALLVGAAARRSSRAASRSARCSTISACRPCPPAAARSPIISATDSQVVLSGGTALDTTISSGGTLILEGSASGRVISDGGLELVSSGGFESSVTLFSGGTLNVLSGGSATGTGIPVSGIGGVVTVANAGIVSGATNGIDLSAGGTVTNSAGRMIEGYYGAKIAGGTVTNSGNIIGIGGGVAPNLYARYGNGSGGGFYGGGFAVFLDGGGSVDNTGTITTTGGRFGDGVFAAYGAATVTNSGSITAPGHYGLGVYLHDGGTVTNAGGYIEGYDGIRFKGGQGS